MGFDFNYEDMQTLCDELLSICDEMKESVNVFAMALEKHSEALDDRITAVVEDVFKRIQSDINNISKYLEDFTGRKQDAARDMEDIQKITSERVKSIGG